MAVAKVADALRNAAGASVRVQLPLRIGATSMPEPDVALVAGRHDDSAGAHPDGALLVVEVADSSLTGDRLGKGRISDIVEYWIVDLVHDVVEVYRGVDPSARVYRRRQAFGRGTAILALAVDVEVSVEDLPPPAAVAPCSPRSGPACSSATPPPWRPSTAMQSGCT